MAPRSYRGLAVTEDCPQHPSVNEGEYAFHSWTKIAVVRLVVTWPVVRRSTQIIADQRAASFPTPPRCRSHRALNIWSMLTLGTDWNPFASNGTL